jgi:hypothetical protein
MYFFVRFTGIVTLILGVLLMLLGMGTVIYGFVQNAALIDFVNNYWLASSNSRLLDARLYAAIIGLGLFLGGMLTSGLGQLLLVFADLANNTKETNLLLRGLRSAE